MNQDQAEKWVKRQLGEGIVDVELTCAQLKDCLEAAYRWFNDHRGLRVHHEMNWAANQSEYDLSALVPVVEEVLAVSFTNGTDVDLRAIYGDDLALPGVPWGQFPYGGLQAGTYSSLVQAMQYRETASRIMSADVDWVFKKLKSSVTPGVPKPILFLTPGFNGPGGKVIVEYKAKLTDIADLANDSRNEEFVLRRAQIEAMLLVGRAYRKYGTYPTARGERSLGGGELVSDANEMLTKLEDDLRLVNMPLPFLSK